VNFSSLVFKNLEFAREGFLLRVDTTIPAGKLTVILGPSGSGKTTLLDLSAGFLQPDSGTIMEGDIDVTRLPPDKRKVGVVFQDHALFPHLSVRENVAYGPRVRGKSRFESAKIADKYLEMTRISRYAHKKPTFLSGGEKQRVALARALAIEPGILLLDEPFSSLDASLRRSMRNEVRNIQKQTGITVVLVTHDQEEALSLADYLVLMQDGVIVQMGRPAELWENPKNLFTAMFLGRNSRLAIQKIIPVRENLYLIDTAAGTLQVEYTGQQPPLPATLFIRPENLILSEDGPITGRVCGTEYAGDHWKISLLNPGIGSEFLEINYSGKKPPVIGESVKLKLRKGSAKILPGLTE